MMLFMFALFVKKSFERRKNYERDAHFFGDLNEDAQKRLIDFLGGENGNYDVFPLVVVEVEE